MNATGHAANVKYDVTESGAIFEVRDLAAGTYFVQIQDKNTIRTLRFIKE
jgi:hypothetical protein